MKRLSIGQMAKMNRVSEKALRLYHENGILVPAYVDESSGRRYYDIQQSTKLDMILQLQQMGFSLSEIVEINERQSMEYLQEKAAAQLQVIEKRQQELALSHRLAEGLADSCERLLRMRDYAYNKKMVIAGDAFGESLCRYPRFFDSGDFLLYRLCVPVRPA